MLKIILIFTLLGITLGNEINLNKPIGRVVGGFPATPGQFPWAGYITSTLGMCSCSLLKKNWVMTAGHCLTGVSKGDVYFGHPKRGHADAKHHTFKHVSMHPQYSGAGSFDLALVKLDGNFEFTVNLYPIALPEKNNNFFESLQGYITGFGVLAGNVLPDTMQYSQMNVMSKADCLLQYPDQGEHFTCAYSGTSSACTGDTGGGFVVYYNGAMRVIGVASKVFMANGVCVSTKADGFVRVGAFIDWIEVTAVDEPESCPICPISCK